MDPMLSVHKEKKKGGKKNERINPQILTLVFQPFLGGPKASQDAPGSDRKKGGKKKGKKKIPRFVRWPSLPPTKNRYPVRRGGGEKKKEEMANALLIPKLFYSGTSAMVSH